jgi:hypothetical protein
MLLNPGIKYAWGVDFVCRYLDNIMNDNDLPLISIGSGNGYFEHLFVEKYPHYKHRVICVDPEPGVWNDSKVYFEPEYPDLPALLKDRPTLYEQCLMLFNWCLPDESTYDSEALILGKPRAFVVVYEKFEGENGGAGGKLFHSYTDHFRHKEALSEFSSYNPTLIHATYLPIDADKRYNDHRIEWYGLEKPSQDPNLVNIRQPEEPNNVLFTACSIM